jgi:hypothetical protein
MKHVLLAGLIMTAAALPLSAFANDDDSQCQMNLSKIRDAKVARPNLSDAVKSDVDTTVHRAESARPPQRRRRAGVRVPDAAGAAEGSEQLSRSLYAAI